MQSMRERLYMSPAKRASKGVDNIYPTIATGKPHHLTRKKQRIAWQLGYIKGFEEARAMKLYKHLEET